MCQDDRIHLGSLEHIDVLCLLLFIRYIINDLLFLFFFRRFFGIRLLLAYHVAVLVYNIGFRFFLFVLYLIRIGLIDFQTFRQCQILAIQILKEDVIGHLLTELVILQAAELDERTDVIPVFIVFFLLGLTHTGKLVCNLFRNIIGNLLYKTIVLQRTSGYIQRQIRTVNDTL